MKTVAIPLAVGLFFSLGVPGHGTILYSDAFVASSDGTSGSAYNDNADLTAQNPSGVSGFGGAWVASTFFDVGLVGEGLTFPASPVNTPVSPRFNTSVKLITPIASNQPRMASRGLAAGSIPAGAGATTLWTSSLIATSSVDTDGSNTATFALGDGVPSGVSQLLSAHHALPSTHLISYGIIDGQAAIQYRSESGNALMTVPLLDGVSSPVNLAANDPWFFVIKIQRSFSGAADRVTAWLNPSDTSSEITLDATATAKAVVDHNFWDDTEVVTRIGMDVGGWAEGKTLRYDQLTLGTALADVVRSGTIAPPETMPLSMPTNQAFSGALRTIVPLGAGKLLVGGDVVSGSAVLRKINADGSTDPNWTVNANNVVRSIVVEGSYVYLGGDFTTINSTTRNRVARVSLDTGTLDLNWNPDVGGPVNALAIDGGYLYLGGNFPSVGGNTSLINLARVSKSEGVPDSLWPGGFPNGPVNALALTSSYLYVGGSFGLVGSDSRGNLARFQLSGGSLDPWTQNANGVVIAMAISGDELFVGGTFTTVASTGRNRIASFSGSTGNLLSWNPNLNTG